jgi:gliding motility-associated protein GldM
MALPREPRQKMINMMYLVLTALLALNVSSEILNAFKTVNNSLEETNRVVGQSTSDILTSLEEKKKDPGTAEKATIWYQKAQQAQSYSKSMYEFIDALKKKIADGAKYDPTSDKDKGIDNLDVTTRVMVEKGDGKLLRSKLDEYKKNILGIDSLISKTFTSSLPINTEMPKTKNKSNRTWEAAYFHMVPTVAAMTILSKFQNDVKTSENKVVTYCHEQVGKVIYRQDAFAALAIANTTNALPGQEIEITAGVGGFSKAITPKITIGGQTVALGEDGAAHYKFKADRLGSNSIPVVISYTDQDGQVKNITKTVDYVVGQSSAAVQLDNMNVLFIGVENPVTISGSGSVNQIQASISGGGPGSALRGDGAKRTAWVTEQTEDCTISVRTPDGKVTPVKFRVRLIPDPTSMIGTYKSGNIPAAYFKSQAGVRAILENFYYKTNFNVTSFHITADGAGFEDFMERNNTGAVWNEAQAIITKCRAGSFITIDQIRAVGPDGRSRVLNPLVLALK